MWVEDTLEDTWKDKLYYLSYKVWPYRYRPKELWYRFECWAWHRFTTIKPRTLNFHTWCDKTDLLPHVIFEILTQFIEDECSPGHVQWYGEHGHKITVDGVEKYARDEMQELYDWWKESVSGKEEEDSNVWDRVLRKEYEQNWATIDKLVTNWWEPMNTSKGYIGNLLKQSFASEEDKKEYGRLMHRNNEIIKEDCAIIIKNMQRVCALRESLWT